MRCAVEAVAADAVGVGGGAVDRVPERRLGHRLVESGVEDCHMRDIGIGLHGDFDAQQIGRVVQWSQRDAVPDGVENGVVDHRWLRETVTAVHDPVTHRGQGAGANGDRLLEGLGHRCEPLPMIRHRPLDPQLATLRLVGEGRHRFPDTFDQPGGPRLRPRHVDQLVLDAR